MTEQQLYYKNNLSILQDIVCLVEIKGGTLLLEKFHLFCRYTTVLDT